jgi:hypothetical protein
MKRILLFLQGLTESFTIQTNTPPFRNLEAVKKPLAHVGFCGARGILSNWLVLVAAILFCPGSFTFCT